MTAVCAPAWVVEREADGGVLRLSGDWLARETGVRSHAEMQEIERSAKPIGRLRLDTEHVGRWDSALIVFVCSLDARLELDFTGLPDALQRLLALARADRVCAPDTLSPPHPSVLQRTGKGVIAWWASSVTSVELVGDTVLNIPVMLTGRLSARGKDVLALVKDCGLDALPIITVVNCLVGAILGFVGAVQLQRFGASIYVVDLVGIAMVREMAPIMTAIVMAGRTGGAYAAQIATMQGNEEIDALQTLGIPVHQFLVMPRVIAAVTMSPVLFAYACFTGLLGGLIVCVTTLQMSPIVFFEHLRPAVGGTQFAIGVSKSICFGTFVALAGCRSGLAAGRSASDVGHAATVAVVNGIIGIIALDAVFAVCTEIMGI